MATNIQSFNEPKEIKKPKPLPKPNGDFYQITEVLSKAEQDKLKQVRASLNPPSKVPGSLSLNKMHKPDRDVQPTRMEG